MSKIGKFKEIKGRVVITRGKGKEDWLLIDMEFLLGVMKMFYN